MGVKLYRLDKKSDKGREISSYMLYRARAVSRAMPAIAGYAIVAWDMDGRCMSSYWAARGPIGNRMVPTLVMDTLSAHLTEQVIEEDKSGA